MTKNLGNSQIARAKLQQVIERGQAEGSSVIGRILSEVPQDEIQAARETRVTVDKGLVCYRTRLGETPISDYAFSQLCERAGGGKFGGYAAQLREESRNEGSEWAGRLLEHAAGQHLIQQDGRYLIRRLGGQVRGVLSDSYKRVDCRPMLDAFLGAAQKIETVCAGGSVTETQAVVRIVVPRVYEIVPGEHVIYGLQWQNSDFGAGAYGISDFLLRLLCLNGATGAKQLRAIHLGKRIQDDQVELSARTHALDTETLVSATIDTVGVLLSDTVLDKRTRALAELAEQEINLKDALATVGKTLLKKERDAVVESYEGPDTLNLPAGNSMWRFSNALSFLANDEKKIQSADRRLELQALAGSVLPAGIDKAKKG